MTGLGSLPFDDLVPAVEWAESGGRNVEGPMTRSGERAFGPMQLMPAAVVDYLMANGIPADRATVEQYRRDPGLNREIGRWYLRQQYDRFGGDVPRTLAAYNWGPARVARLGDDFAVDRTPSETQAYIQRIQNRLGGARAQAPQPSPDSGEAPMRDFDESYDSLMNYQPRPMQGLGGMAQAPAPKAGISALNPLLDLAAEVSPMPDRGPAWANALIRAGGAMMASQRPDFLGGMGVGLLAGQEEYGRSMDRERADRIGQLGLGMKLYDAFRKDEKPTVVPENGSVWLPGIGFVKNPNAGGKPLSDEAKIEADFKAGLMSPETYNAAMAKRRGENESNIAKLRREREQFQPGTPEYKEYTDAINRAGGGVTVNNTPEGKFQQGMAELQVDVVKDARSQAVSAMGMMPAFAQMTSALDAGLQTGQFAPVRDMFARIALDIGVPQAAVDAFWNTKDARVFDSASKSLVLGIIKGLGANPSNADREFIEKTLPNLRDPVEAARAIMEHARKRAETRISYYEGLNAHIGNGGNAIQYETDWMRKNLAETPWKNAPREDFKAPATQQQPAPQTSPQSGAPAPGRPVGQDAGKDNIPTITSPDDPAFRALPKGSVFRDSTGRLLEKQ